jgi:hypothetical protein
MTVPSLLYASETWMLIISINAWVFRSVPLMNKLILPNGTQVLYCYSNATLDNVHRLNYT